MAGIFDRSTLTTAGAALLAKAQAGECGITLTKAVTGANVYGEDDDLESLTALTDQRQEVSLSAIRVSDETSVYVRFVVSNAELDESYNINEVGIYATDPDEGDILYAVAASTTGSGDYLPAYDGTESTVTIDFLVAVSSTEDVTITQETTTYIYGDDGTAYTLSVSDGRLTYTNEDETATQAAALEDVYEILLSGTISAGLTDSDGDTLTDSDGDTITGTFVLMYA